MDAMTTMLGTTRRLLREHERWIRASDGKRGELIFWRKRALMGLSQPHYPGLPASELRAKQETSALCSLRSAVGSTMAGGDVCMADL